MTDIAWIGYDRNEVREAARILAISAGRSGGKLSKAVYPDDSRESGNVLFGYTRIGSELTSHDLPGQFDYCIVLDDDIIDKAEIPLDNDGILIVNTSRHDRSFDVRFHTITIDGSYLAQSVLGKPDPHIAMIGAFTAISNLVRYNAAIDTISAESIHNVEKRITLFALSYGAILSGSSL
jgi:Pyruvate/2-oxoacid:ferredoxin oxidoreductase gamma subunit